MNEKGTIVILETDQDLWQELKTDLTALGYQAARGPFPKTEIAAITSLQPAAVIIGLTEWDDDRLQACELLLEEGKLPSDVPVIALIAGATLHEMFHRLGFADIIMRPYRLPELDFRLKRAIHQYRQRVNRDIIDIGEMSISLASYEVKIGGELIPLTFKEYELLKHLAINRGLVYTRESLLNNIWGADYYGGIRTVDVHIRRIRAKLDDIDGTYIKTVRGVGYTFRTDT